MAQKLEDIDLKMGGGASTRRPAQMVTITNSWCGTCRALCGPITE